MTDVAIPAGAVTLGADLDVPAGARGIVAFAHGSGSGRFSPRNRLVAGRLRDRALGTLLMDLLTQEEETIDRSTGDLRFDIDLLAERTVAAVDHLAGRGDGEELPIGLFGASTGAAAALVASARRPNEVRAVVSRGGRPDLAADQLPSVQAPTLLLVGELDVDVLELNRRAKEAIRAEVRLEVVPGAGHLFEEPGALEEVARRAGDWFERHLR